jgi:resuscitation-promoting factor RpfB
LGRRTALRAGLVCLIVAAAAFYATLDKGITIRDDGEVRHVRTFALNVGDALERAGVFVGDLDRVTPALSSALTEGSLLTVLRAKPVTIVMNGNIQRVVVTSLTVGDVLDELRLRGGLIDFVGPSRGASVKPGMTIEYRQAVALTVVHDGRKDGVITNAASVRTMLEEIGVRLVGADRVAPSLDTRPTDKMTVKIIRVGTRRESIERAIRFRTITRRDKHLEFGTSKVITAGRDGLRRLNYLTTYVDGKRTKRRYLGATVIEAPVPRVIHVGAGFPTCRCNRGSESGKATWYAASGLTAAHKTLPFGTVVRVTDLSTGRSVTVVIRDRGPYGPGRIIDLSDNAFSRLRPLGTGIIRVKIRW